MSAKEQKSKSSMKSSGPRVLRSSTTSQSAKSGTILVSASSPMVDTVQPPPDERNAPMCGWLPMPEEALTVKVVELDGKEYQVLKNTASKEPEPQLLPDREHLERNQSMDMLLARLNSQLLESSQDAINAKRRARSKDSKAVPANQQTRAAAIKVPPAFKENSKNPPAMRASEVKSKSTSKSARPSNGSKSDNTMNPPKKDNGQKSYSTSSNSSSNKTKSANSYSYKR